MNLEIENKFLELNRRVKLTSKARYNASRRLTLHNTLSQWTLALLSVALILISLISASGLEIHFSQKYVNVMQIVFAVLVLTYSLLLATGDYSARSVEMHRCGMELGRLARKIKPYEGKQNDDDTYKGFYDEYYNCLEKYENHSNVDYLSSDYYTTNWYEKNRIESSVFKSYIFLLCRDFYYKYRMYFIIKFKEIYPVSHYFISIVGVYYWLFLMVRGV